ncbi:MAG: InlB B-repeat-containing protein, partial [Lawsonibacter sp.]
MKIRKKVIPIMLSLLMILTLLPIAVPVQALSSSGFAGGTGTVEDPYQIATADQLKRVRWCMYNNSTPNSFILTADITLSASDNWTPIGSTGTNDAFAGTFDGNWHTISNVNIVGTSDTYYGFFGYVSRPAVIRNLKLINVSVSANSSVAVGGLIGTARNLFQSGSGSGCLIENCYVQGTVSNLGGGATGALVGCLYSASSYTHTVSGCCAEVTVSGGNYVSGLVGEANYTSISDCCAMDPVTATGNYVGGLVGELYNSSSITNSYAIGAVTCTGAGTDVGGLIGYTSWSTVTNSYYNSENTEQSDTDKGTPKTTAEMTTATTYSDWSSDIWNITDSAYPVLKSFDSTAYLVTYNLNGGSGTTPTETEKSAFETFTAASSDGLTPPSSPAGMVFKEWNTEPDGSGAAYASCAQVGMPPNSLTLYAIWALQYTVTYEANGGDYAPLDGNVYFAGDICTVASSASMTVPDGMMFQEWNTKDDGSGTTYYGNQGFSMPSSNVTLFAIWETLQNGSEAYPYLVNDDTDLDKVSHYNNSGVHFRQTADITLPSGWQPIGDSSDPFLGIYDGG